MKGFDMTTLNHCNRLECSQIVESLNVELRRQHEEIERLTACLKKANSNHEEFERKWYLSQDALRLALEALEMLTDDYDDSAVGIEIEAITKIKEVLG